MAPHAYTHVYFEGLERLTLRMFWSKDSDLHFEYAEIRVEV